MAYQSRFTISSAASDRKLVTSAEVLAELGSDFFASGVDVNSVILQISDMIAKMCCVPAAAGNIPTLKSETLVETFRDNTSDREGYWPYPLNLHHRKGLRLSRYPVTSVTSVVVDGTTLANTDYEIWGAEGILVRLYSDRMSSWTGAKIVVTYVAGYATVPDDLKHAAITLIAERYRVLSEDPALRREQFEGLGEFQYSSMSADKISPAAVSMLATYSYPLQ